jgi:hypothetical protein
MTRLAKRAKGEGLNYRPNPDEGKSRVRLTHQ